MADTISTADPGTDWGSMLDGAATQMGKPLSSTPGAFASYYGPIADQVSQNTGIDSNTILGQWGLETGWGKSVIPGTNNLGNMKVKQGQQGVSATDNQTGSNDQYQQFQNPGDFANAYTQLLQSNYKGALNTGTDANATAKALKAGGYAQDPNYVSKLTNAASMVAQARGQAPNMQAQGSSSGPISSAGAADWGAMLDQALPAIKGAATSDTTEGLGFVPMAQFNAKNGINPQANEAANSDPNALVALGAGLGRGVQQTALGAQALLGKGAQALGADNVGNWLVNDAQQGNTAGGQQYGQAAGNSLSGKVGQVVGSTAPALFAGPELLPQIAAGAGYGASNAALNNENIAQGTVEGAGMGAAGAALGQGLGAAVQAAKPLVTKALSATRGGEDAATASIARQLGDTLDPTIANLNANSNEIIPGSLPTAAEAANNPVLTRIQRGLQNTEAGQEAFPARQAANNDARLQAGQNAVGPNSNNSQMMGPGLDAQAQAFTQSQAQRVQQGLQEVAPLSNADAATMQTPAYQRAITAARSDAQNSGITSFADQSSTLNRNLADQIDQVAGTPESLEAAQATRRAQGASDYASVAGDIPADTPAFADLTVRPGFNTALRRAAGIEDNMNGSAAANPITQGAPTRSLQMGDDGMMNWVETPGPRTVDAGILQGTRSRLSGMAQQAAQSGDAATAKGFRDTLTAVDNFLGNPIHVGSNIADSFNNARANYAANSVPIDQQTLLQSKLAPAVNNLTGEVNPGTLNSTINAVQRGQLKPGLRPEDRITPEQLQALQGIGQQARLAPTNLTGLDAQGQEVLRQQLAAQVAAGKAPQSAMDAYNARLAGQSPSYQALQDMQATQGADIASRQQLAASLDKLSQAAHNATGQPGITLPGARSLANNGDLQGVQADYAKSLLADLQRASSANAPLGAAGSQTAANMNLGGGLLGDLIGAKINNHTIGTAIATGHPISAVIGAIGQKLLGAANVKTEKAAIDLLLNPKKLATALEKFKNQPGTGEAFVAALKNKAAQGGKTGVAAVQAYEAATQH